VSRTKLESNKSIDRPGSRNKGKKSKKRDEPAINYINSVNNNVIIVHGGGVLNAPNLIPGVKKTKASRILN